MYDKDISGFRFHVIEQAIVIEQLISIVITYKL